MAGEMRRFLDAVADYVEARQDYNQQRGAMDYPDDYALGPIADDVKRAEESAEEAFAALLARRGEEVEE